MVSVGASGAVFGVTGAMLVAVGKNREQIPETLSKRLIVQLAVFIAYALLQGFSRQGIDNAAHIGGLIGGSALALLPARTDMSRYQRTAAVSLLAGLALGTLSIAALAMLAPKAALDQRAALASEDHMKHGLLEFVRILKSVQADEQALRAGTLSTKAIAERERNQYIPALRQIDTELSGVKLRPGDPRQPLVADITRGTELMIEAMSLDAANDSGNRQPKPADQAHLASLRAQLREIGEQIRQETAEIRKRAGGEKRTSRGLAATSAEIRRCRTLASRHCFSVVGASRQRQGGGPGLAEPITSRSPAETAGRAAAGGSV